MNKTSTPDEQGGSAEQPRRSEGNITDLWDLHHELDRAEGMVLFKYVLVVDPGDGEPVRPVRSFEWDDEHKLLVLSLD